MTETPPDALLGSDTPETGADRLNAALVGFTGCIGTALADICSYGLTIGETYVPFDPDEEDECDEDEVACNQAWVRVTLITPVSSNSWEGDCATVMRVSLEVGVLRCIEIGEHGSAPTATDVLVASMQSMTDMNAIFCAAMDCEVWASIEAGQWNPDGPLGGQYGGIWTFTVEL